MGSLSFESLIGAIDREIDQAYHLTLSIRAFARINFLLNKKHRLGRCLQLDCDLTRKSPTLKYSIV